MTANGQDDEELGTRPPAAGAGRGQPRRHCAICGPRQHRDSQGSQQAARHRDERGDSLRVLVPEARKPPQRVFGPGGKHVKCNKGQPGDGKRPRLPDEDRHGSTNDHQHSHREVEIVRGRRGQGRKPRKVEERKIQRIRDFGAHRPRVGHHPGEQPGAGQHGGDRHRSSNRSPSRRDRRPGAAAYAPDHERQQARLPRRGGRQRRRQKWHSGARQHSRLGLRPDSRQEDTLPDRRPDPLRGGQVPQNQDAHGDGGRDQGVARPLGHWPLRSSWEYGKLTNEAANSGVSAQAAGCRGRTAEARNVRPIGQIMPPMTIADRLAAFRHTARDKRHRAVPARGVIRGPAGAEYRSHAPRRGAAGLLDPRQHVQMEDRIPALRSLGRVADSAEQRQASHHGTDCHCPHRLPFSPASRGPAGHRGALEAEPPPYQPGGKDRRHGSQDGRGGAPRHAHGVRHHASGQKDQQSDGRAECMAAGNPGFSGRSTRRPGRKNAATRRTTVRAWGSSPRSQSSMGVSARSGPGLVPQRSG